MQFVFDERKATHAAAYLLARGGGTMPYIKLIKLLYLADRESLLETGYTITGDRMVSMDKGPVLSRVYDHLVEEQQQPGIWQRFISPPENFCVSVRDEPAYESLSDYEIGLLNQVFEKFGDWDRWALVEWTHGLPEWVDPRGSSLSIDPAVILREAGRSDDEVRGIAAEVEAIRAFRQVAAMTR